MIALFLLFFTCFSLTYSVNSFKLSRKKSSENIKKINPQDEKLLKTAQDMKLFLENIYLDEFIKEQDHENLKTATFQIYFDLNFDWRGKKITQEMLSHKIQNYIQSNNKIKINDPLLEIPKKFKDFYQQLIIPTNLPPEVKNNIDSLDTLLIGYLKKINDRTILLTYKKQAMHIQSIKIEQSK